MFRTNSATQLNFISAWRPPRTKSIDSEEFARLYDAYVDKIYNYIYYKIGSTTQAEDLTSEVFAKAWQARGRYHWTQRPFSAWLYRIAHNLVVDHYRTQHETVPIDGLISIDAAEKVEELAEQHLDSEMVRKAMQGLTQDQKQVIRLKFMEEYDTDEVAQIMGRGPTAIRALQHRALLSLCRILRKETGRDRQVSQAKLVSHVTAPQGGYNAGMFER